MCVLTCSSSIPVCSFRCRDVFYCVRYMSVCCSPVVNKSLSDFIDYAFIGMCMRADVLAETFDLSVSEKSFVDNCLPVTTDTLLPRREERPSTFSLFTMISSFVLLNRLNLFANINSPLLRQNLVPEISTLK